MSTGIPPMLLGLPPVVFLLINEMPECSGSFEKKVEKLLLLVEPVLPGYQLSLFRPLEILNAEYVPGGRIVRNS